MKRKGRGSSSGQKRLKAEKEVEDPDPVLGTVFEGLKVHIHPANFGSFRLKIFEKQVKRFGGEVVEELPESCENLSHIIFEESIDAEKVTKLVNPEKFPSATFIRCTWLSQCLKNKSKVSTQDHEFKVRAEKHKTKSEKGSNQTEQATLKDVSLDVTENCETKVGPEEQKAECELELSSLPEQSKEDILTDVDVDNPLHISDTKITSHQEDKSCTNLEDGNSRPIKNIDVASCSGMAESSCIDTFQGENAKENQLSGVTETPKPGLQAVTTGDGEGASFIKPKFKLQDKFVCSQASSSQTKGFNSHITSELEKLAATYKSKNDTWRAVGYQKAISAIRNYPKEITTREEALSIRGIGARLADKVAEIVESGKLRKVAEICYDEEAQALKLFMGVWGAGPTTAQIWYTKGYRTLEHLRTKANLTRHQQIGLRLYDDINSRIPRDEVVEIENYVRETALSIKKGLIVTVCGSYRRGKPTCGDVDILITHPDGLSHDRVFKPILQKLRDLGFLTDDLVTQEDNGNQKKYLGVCLLPGENRKHRRLDVIVVPYAEFAPALLYFTGSAHFNRSMRLLAIKMGMSLSEHGLRAGIIRQGREKLTEGRLLDTPTEESIFKHLGLEYRSPRERDH